MPDSTCSVADCGAACSARGWCAKHYQRWRKNGDPLLATKRGVTASPACLVCANPVSVKGLTGPLASYCSKQCQRRAGYLRSRESMLAARREETAAARRVVERTCPQCDGTFTPAKSLKQRFCSRNCGRLFANAVWRDGRSVCADDGCQNKSVSRGLCRQHHPTAGQWSRNGDPETRRANLRRKTQKRRARLMGDTEAESIDRDLIGDRDGWCCGLCGKRVDRGLTYPHRQSASLDHIVPLSLGGKHVLANVQIAHLTCNVAKGNRGGGEQLLLVG